MEEDRLSELQGQVQRLSERMAELEKLVAHAPPKPVAPWLPPAPAPKQRAPKKEKRTDLEAEIGGNWLNRIGALALVLGAAFFLKYAIDNRWIDETGRVILGMIVGLALIFGGERSQKRGMGRFAQGLSGAGIAILYLSTFSAFAFYRLIPQTPALAFMVLITVAAGAISVRYNSVVIAILGMIGGFLTPILVRQQGGGGGGGSQGVELLTYLAVLDLGVLGVTYYKNWRALNLLSAAFTVAIFAGWYYEGEPMGLGSMMVFLTVFYAIFAAQSFVQNVVVKRPMNAADLVLVIATPIVYFWASYSMLRPEYYIYLGVFALAMCAVYLWMSQRVRLAGYEDRKLRLLFLCIAAGFLTAAIPIQLQGSWVPIGWSAEAAVITAIGLYLNSARTRWVAAGLFGLAVVRFVCVDWATYMGHEEVLRPFRNPTFAAALFTVAMMVVAVWLYGRRPEILCSADRAVQVALALSANALAILVLCGEVLNWLTVARLGGTGLDTLSVSAVMAIYGAAMLSVGIALKHRPARIMALVLLGIVILKSFVFDVWLMERAYRIVAFVGLGALLLAASYVYQVQKDRIRQMLVGEGDGDAS